MLDYGWSDSHAASETDIAHVQELCGREIPESLKRIAREHDGASPYARSSFRYKDSTQPSGNVKNSFAFAAFTKRAGAGMSVGELNEFYRELMPDMIAFGTDPYGGLLALDYEDGPEPSVVFIDFHDPDEARCYKVSPSFEAFMDSLEPQSELSPEQMAAVKRSILINSGKAKWDENGAMIETAPSSANLNCPIHG